VHLLDKEGLVEEHVAIGKHNFPKGHNARDFILCDARMPGGLVQAGSLPDQEQRVLLRKLLHPRPEFMASRMHAVLVNLTEERMLWDIGSHLGFWRYLRSFTIGSQSCIPAK
jgi:hypothetical protein